MSWKQSTFALPLVIGLLSLLGLFCALLGDGMWDWVAWLGLGIPALLGCWPLLFRPRKPTTR
ncbi:MULTISPECIES: hypothetical protein [Pseudomonas]|uniref:DUF4175 domain-containing protein n=1 Tax=Pseudomonas segetis TaxID=298908 RepID=A0A239I9Q7_9PSED|nr:MULTISPECIES: hypothetical protein [Pseudomonas]SNS89074.1 hypothetical protein SAMN05216255_3729 [Pseudomonas segetis]